MSLPFPTNPLILAINQFPLFLLPHMLLKSLHHIDPGGLSILLSKLFQDSYFDMMSLPNLHFHLLRSALLKQDKFLFLRPPLSLLLHIVSHLTQATIFPSYPNPYRNCLSNFVTSFNHEVRHLKDKHKEQWH